MRSFASFSLLSLFLLPGMALAQAPAARQPAPAAPARTAAPATAYRPHTQLGDAVIQVDPETRSLVIIADQDTQDHIDQVIRSLDRPKPQVLIKVLFLEVTHRDSLDLGVQGTQTSARGDILEGTVRTAWGLAQELEGGFWNLTGADFTATLRAMAERGKLEVLSRPSILARNNQEAVIIVGEEVPFITSSRITDAGSAINTIEYAEVGIILRVTPFITSEDQVEMIVAPEISNLTERTVPVSELVRAPVIAKRAAETVVVTPHGQTVVIGGLMETQKTETVRRVPILGDIPLLGMLFRRTIREDVKKELVIFLTPYIVARPGELAAVSRDELEQTPMTTRLLDRESSRRFVDELLMPGDETPEPESEETP